MGISLFQPPLLHNHQMIRVWAQLLKGREREREKNGEENTRHNLTSRSFKARIYMYIGRELARALPDEIYEGGPLLLLLTFKRKKKSFFFLLVLLIFLFSKLYIYPVSVLHGTEKSGHLRPPIK